MWSPVDTGDAQAVEAEVVSVYRRLFREEDTVPVHRTFQWALECFHGRYPGFLTIDAGYHDLEHTLQGTLCLARLLDGRGRSGVLPRINKDVFDLALIAILFHDTGYLKETGDTEGTGAKYTLVHVDRSVDFAGQFMALKGFEPGEILAVQQMIRCTGVNVNLAEIPFQNDSVRLAGYCLGTADLLGQMAASDYPDKLPVLYEEFLEAANFNGGWSANFGPFENAIHLMSQTNGFFTHYVKPKLETDLGGVFRFLTVPYPDGANEYMEKINKNLARVTSIVDAAGA